MIYSGSVSRYSARGRWKDQRAGWRGACGISGCLIAFQPGLTVACTYTDTSYRFVQITRRSLEIFAIACTHAILLWKRNLSTRKCFRYRCFNICPRYLGEAKKHFATLLDFGRHGTENFAIRRNFLERGLSSLSAGLDFVKFRHRSVVIVDSSVTFGTFRIYDTPTNTINSYIDL